MIVNFIKEYYENDYERSSFQNYLTDRTNERIYAPKNREGDMGGDLLYIIDVDKLKNKYTI